MTQKQCIECQHQRTCADVYHRLGHGSGPDITSKVLIAFVLPLLVFVLCLGMMQYLLGDYPAPLMWLVSLVVSMLMSIMIVLCCILILREGKHDH